jgi:hypothetical protein
LLFELLQFLLSFSLSVLEFQSLPVQCFFSSSFGLFKFGFSLEPLLSGSPLPLNLRACLRFPALTVAFLHLYLPQLDLPLLLSQDPLCLHLKLFLLFLPLFLPDHGLSLPGGLLLPLLLHELLLLPRLLLCPLALLKRLPLGFLSYTLLFTSLTLFLLQLSPTNFLQTSFLLFPLFYGFLLIVFPDSFKLQFHFHHLLHLFFLSQLYFLDGAFLLFYHRG